MSGDKAASPAKSKEFARHDEVALPVYRIVPNDAGHNQAARHASETVAPRSTLHTSALSVVLRPIAVLKRSHWGGIPFDPQSFFEVKLTTRARVAPRQRAEMVIVSRIFLRCCRDGTDAPAWMTYKNNYGITGVNKSVKRLETGDAVQISSGCCRRCSHGGEFGFCGRHADEGGADGRGGVRHG
jgi:hypothetical protein